MIRWGTLITDTQGVIDHVKLRSLAAIMLAVAGGIAAVWVVFIVREVSQPLYYGMIVALVLPLTGAKVADVLSGRSLTAKVQAGILPDRRASDPNIPGPGQP